MSVKIFKIPDEHVKDYYHFLRGEYSQYSESAVAKVLANNIDITTPNKRNIYKGIFKKSKTLRVHQEKRFGMEIGNAEVWSIYNRDKNILTDKLKKSFDSYKIEPITEF